MKKGTKVIFVKGQSSPDQMTPPVLTYVFLDGKPLGMLTDVSISIDTKTHRPLLTLQRMLYDVHDEVQTMTEQEFEEWKKKDD